ncbi:MAG: hypothetical protein Q9210_000191 [Variospora velana]
MVNHVDDLTMVSQLLWGRVLKLENMSDNTLLLYSKSVLAPSGNTLELIASYRPDRATKLAKHRPSIIHSNKHFAPPLTSTANSDSDSRPRSSRKHPQFTRVRPLTSPTPPPSDIETKARDPVSAISDPPPPTLSKAILARPTISPSAGPLATCDISSQIPQSQPQLLSPHLSQTVNPPSNGRRPLFHTYAPAVALRSRVLARAFDNDTRVV